jgi:hypothetical protein
MMTIGAMGFDGNTAAVVVTTTAIGTLALHIFWIVAALRYRGSRVRLVRLLGVAYLAMPLLIAGAFAISVDFRPLVHCSEPLGGDARPMGYTLAWLVLGSVIAFIGVIVLALQANWKTERSTAEPATAPYSEPAARSPQG